MSESNKKFSRSHYLINSKLQLSLVFYFMMIGVAVGVGGYWQLSCAIQGAITGINEGIPGIDVQSLPLLLESLKIDLLRQQAISSIAGLVTIFLGGILISHRIAGPLYRIESAMKAYLEKGDQSEVHLRKNDFAGSLAVLYNQLIKKASK